MLKTTGVTNSKITELLSNLCCRIKGINMNLINIFINKLHPQNRSISLIIRGVLVVKSSQFVVCQSSYSTIINIMVTMKPAPVAGFGVYNGLILTAKNTITFLNTLVTQNTCNSKSRGVSNILNFLSLQNSFAFTFVRTNSDLELSVHQIFVGKGVGVNIN